MKRSDREYSYEDIETYLKEYSLNQPPYDFNGLLHLVLIGIDNLRRHHNDADLETYAGVITYKQLEFLNKLIECSDLPLISSFQIKGRDELPPFYTERISNLLADCLDVINDRVPDVERKEVVEMLSSEQRNTLKELANHSGFSKR